MREGKRQMSKILFRLKSDLKNNFYPPLTLSSHSTYAVTSLIWESAAKPSSCHPSLPPVRSPCDAKSHLGEKRKGSDTCLPDLHRRRQHQRRLDTWTPTVGQCNVYLHIIAPCTPTFLQHPARPLTSNWSSTQSLDISRKVILKRQTWRKI